MNHEQITSIIRQLLLVCGGFVVSMGWFDNETMIQIAGGLSIVVGSLWALWDRRNKGLVKSAAAIVPISDTAQKSVGIEHPKSPA